VRSLHVAQVCADRGIAPGSTKGAAQHLRGLAAGLANLGHDVITYAAREPEGPYPVPVVGLGDLADPGADAIDVVYERYSLGHRSGLDHARARGVPFVLEVNAPLVDEAAIHRPDTVDHAAPDVEAELLAEADLVVTVSGELTRWVGRRRTGPTVTVRNGFEPRWFREPRADHAAIRYPLVFLGHPKPWHGADRIVSLLLDLARLGHHPDALVIGGGSGGDVVRRAARRARVADRLHITGPLPPDRASAMLAEAGIGLAPYPRQEPFYFCPLKVIDYLAAGLPVVATDQGDIPQIVGRRLPGRPRRPRRARGCRRRAARFAPATTHDGTSRT